MELKEKEALEYLVLENNYWIDEYGWINQKEFCVWIYYRDLPDVLEYLENVFGSDLLVNNHDYNAYLSKYYVCVNLTSLFDYEELLEVFPYEKYQH